MPSIWLPSAAGLPALLATAAVRAASRQACGLVDRRIHQRHPARPRMRRR